MLAAAEDKKVSVYQFSEDPEVVPRIIASLVGHSNRYAPSLSSIRSHLTLLV